MVPLCFSTLAYQMTSFNRAYLFPLDFNFFYDDLSICHPTKVIGIEERGSCECLKIYL